MHQPAVDFLGKMRKKDERYPAALLLESGSKCEYSCITCIIHADNHIYVIVFLYDVIGLFR